MNYFSIEEEFFQKLEDKKNKNISKIQINHGENGEFTIKFNDFCKLYEEVKAFRFIVKNIL